MSDDRYVSEQLGKGIIQAHDHLQEILLSMVSLGEPEKEYSRLVVLLSALELLSMSLKEKVEKQLREAGDNVVYGDFFPKDNGGGPVC